MPRKQHTAVNTLSQRPKYLEDTKSNKEEEDINNQILFKLKAYKICLVELKANLSDQSREEDLELWNRRQILQYIKNITIRLRTKEGIDLDNKLSSDKDLEYKTPISSTKYNKELIRIASYLTILKKLKNISRTEFRKFKKEALKYGVYSQKLQRLLIKGMPIKLVINKEEMRAQILRDVYN